VAARIEFAGLLSLRVRLIEEQTSARARAHMYVYDLRSVASIFAQNNMSVTTTQNPLRLKFIRITPLRALQVNRLSLKTI
jgi:hypothetical protein